MTLGFGGTKHMLSFPRQVRSFPFSLSTPFLNSDFVIGIFSFLLFHLSRMQKALRVHY